MSNLATEARRKVVEALEAQGLTNVHTVVPTKFFAPAVLVGPDLPYITREGATFRGRNLRLVISLVAGKGANEERAEELDSMISTALDAMDNLSDPEPWAVNDVDAPGTLAINGTGEYLATSIHVSVEINI